MRDAIAKAICCPDGQCMAGNVGPTAVPCLYQDWLPAVDAVLAVLEKPSEAMLDAARDWSGDEYGKPIGNEAAIGCFTAMIRAASK